MRTAWLPAVVLLLALGIAEPTSAQTARESIAPPATDSQPTTGPASQPTTQPDSQPTTRPDSQPASQPTTRPGAALASRPASERTSSRPSSKIVTSTSTTTAATTQATKEKDRFLAVVNGRVFTMNGPVLERATVLCKGAVITAIGTNIQLPPECEVVDADGLFVYPGLIAAAAGGIHGGGDPTDSTNVFGLNMTVALAGGITTAITENTAAKLTFGTTQNMVVKSNLFVNLAYSTHTPLDRAQTRADLERVRTYLRDVRKFEREKAANKDAKPPDKEWLKDKYENYRKLLQREAVAVCSASTLHELREIVDLASTYDFDVVVRGAYEGWILAPALGRAGVRAIITPRADVNPDERLNRPSGSSIENARILRDHGVTLAVVPPTPSITLWGLAGRDLLQLNMEAAFAVRGGLSNEDALRTITIDAARVLGIDDRVGSLEVGKDADLVVCDGDLLHYLTQVRYTIVNGRVAYDKTKDTLFGHIRPKGKPEVPTFDDQWPKRLEWPK